jgi:hypothetical protein
MLLPANNSLVLADDNEHWVADGSEPPAIDDDALLALLPAFARRGDSEVRAAYLAALRKAFNFCWAQWGQVLAAQKTPRYAWGPWLEVWGELLKRTRVVGEEDPQYRERLLTPIDMVTPAALKSAIFAIADRVSLIDPLIVEPAEAMMYFSDDAGTLPWQDYWQPDNTRIWRTLADGTPVVGKGAYIGPDTEAATFWVVLAEDPQTDGSYLSDQIISEVEQRRAAGVSWMLFIDPAMLHGA